MFVEHEQVGDLTIKVNGKELIDEVGITGANLGELANPIVFKDNGANDTYDMYSGDAPWPNFEFYPECGETCFEEQFYGQTLSSLTFTFIDDSFDFIGKVKMIKLLFEEDCVYEPRCGDGYTDPDFETCDDGNVRNGDGCSRTCQAQCGFECPYDG